MAKWVKVCQFSGARIIEKMKIGIEVYLWMPWQRIRSIAVDEHSLSFCLDLLHRLLASTLVTFFLLFSDRGKQKDKQKKIITKTLKF